MMKLWNLLVHGHHCEHKWKILEKGPILRSGHTKGDLPIGTIFPLQCAKCGGGEVRSLR